jgi:hypothetical protein
MPRENKGWEPEGPEEIAELLEMVSDKIPNLIRGVMESFFSPEAASNMGKAVAEFRKTLIDGGIPEDEAMEMTREYLRTLTSWKGVVREASEGHRSRHTRE